MSWSITGLVIPGEQGAQAAVDALVAGYRQNAEDGYAPRLEGEVVDEQVAAASAAVAALVESGRVGSGPFQVMLAGHANPGHGDVDGMSNDYLTVTVSRVTPDPADDEPAAAGEEG